MAKNDKDNGGIKISANGPYIVTGAVIVQPKGQESLPKKQTVALCRCGQSANKPFCDGTHAKVGFDGSETADRGSVSERRVAYKRQGLTIYDDRSICAHAGVCTNGLPNVWKLGVEPWIDPNGAEIDEIVEIIAKCPSGALSYSLERGSAPEEAAGPEVVTYAPGGPYVVTGKLPLHSSDGAEYGFHAPKTLCRCGGSQNKPFCDGSHWNNGFSDAGE